MTNIIDAFDHWLFLLINQKASSPVADLFFSETTLLGSVVIWAAVAVFLWASGQRKNSLTLILGLVIASVVVSVLKFGLMRERPFEVLLEARILEQVATGTSMPSGHAARAALGAAILGRKFRKASLLVWILAMLVGYSRIYLGAHWPTDVIAGGILGYAIGLLILRFEESMLAVFPERLRVEKHPSSKLQSSPLSKIAVGLTSTYS